MATRKLAKRACDACKVRKIRCSETQPCEGCKASKIECTYLKQAAQRGPRRLRDATLQEIRKAQDILQFQSKSARRGNSKSLDVDDPDPPPEPSTEVAHLVLYLCVFRVQLYPLWPIIKVERLIASLQSETPDIEVFALAYALAAATATRTQSTDLSIAKNNQAQLLEEKCQAARAKVPQGRAPNLTTVRIAFFLHIYYDSLETNSMKSMLYLREAVTIATMIGMHKEAYYLDVPVQEREIRRRVLWLLFITERVIAVLYEQPITLRPRIELPSTIDTDEIDVLVGFQILARAFRRLDDAGMFNILDELDDGASPSSNGFSNWHGVTADFSIIVNSEISHRGYIPAVQRLDLLVTRCWLLVMNLRILQMSGTGAGQQIDQCVQSIVDSGQEMLEQLAEASLSCTEAHGSALQLKASTIIGTLDALTQDDIENDELHYRCMNITTQLRHKFAVRKSRTSEKSLSNMPVGQAAQVAFDQIKMIPESQSIHEILPRSPITHEESFSLPNFAVSSNYEGLFDAVDQAGNLSPCSIEDIFNQSSLEHYRNFDDTWSPVQSPNITNNGFARAQQMSLDA